VGGVEKQKDENKKCKGRFQGQEDVHPIAKLEFAHVNKYGSKGKFTPLATALDI
jgi:hypothetical protein